MTTHQTKTLTWDIFVAPAAPIVSDNLAPGQSWRTWSPICAPLLSGARDAVLVDPLMTFKQGHALFQYPHLFASDVARFLDADVAFS